MNKWNVAYNKILKTELNNIFFQNICGDFNNVYV